VRYVFYIFWFVLIAAIVGFTSLNAQWVKINYYFHAAKIFLPFLLFLVLFVGFVLGILTLSPTILKLKSKHRRFKKENRELQKQEKEKGSNIW